MICIEHGPGRQAVAFDRPQALFVAKTAGQVVPMLAAAEAARGAGAWIAGYIAYEAGYALEPRLRALMPGGQRGPLVCLAAFDGPMDADPVLEAAADQARAVRLGPVEPCLARASYAAAFARIQGYIAAGDCYQINLTFPMEARLSAGTALGLYGAWRVAQPVGFGAFVDLGEGPVVVSRSPELFFRVTDGVIESRPMKGTAPRSDDPVEDAWLAGELHASDKARAENLMIVDLLRNDIARMSEIGSVKVPELFAVDSFATVHQMSSRVQGRLLPGAGLPGLMAALFPCGSVTGAPKIRAMEIIAEVEAEPRGVYCGAVGWAAPGGDQCWSVAIRTARVWPDGEVRLNVGGGVVHDSTESGEWEEALWKARFAAALARRG
ncbi:MAG: aminodeoxychorismate synthase component I [Rhodobacteraceae bacterium]|nr:aminodeoxychorismate synthase component I [Paracoccaceae bacterium]